MPPRKRLPTLDSMASVTHRTDNARADMRDTYLMGNPASYRMPVRPRSYYPELLQTGFYDDTMVMMTLWEDMLAKDGIIYGTLEQRRAAVLSHNMRLLPASHEETDLAVAAFIGKEFDAIGGDDGGFQTDLMHLLDGIFKGISIMELVWRVGSDGKIHLDSLLQRPPSNFRFNQDGALFLAPTDLGAPKPVADRKYLVLRFGGSYENPYGCGLLTRLWWYYEFKIANMRAWQIANEKFGSPTATVTIPAGSDRTVHNSARDIIERISTDTGVVLPDGITLDLLESSTRTAGANDPFRSLMEYCDDAIARCVLGSTLTGSEGRRAGSLALGRVHMEVAKDKIEQDARALMWAVQRLMRWMVDLNFGPEVATPIWSIDTAGPDETKADLEVDRALLDMGLVLPRKYFYERYQRPEPIEGDATLTAKPQLVEAIHVPFLTPNEIRASAGMPAVPGGDTVIGQTVESPPPPADENAEMTEEIGADVIGFPNVGRHASPGKEHTQSVLFDKKLFDKERARAWLKAHKMHSDGLDETEGRLRFRQVQPDAAHFYYRTKRIAKGITLIVGYPLSSAESTQSRGLWQRLAERILPFGTSRRPGDPWN